MKTITLFIALSFIQFNLIAQISYPVYPTENAGGFQFSDKMALEGNQLLAASFSLMPGDPGPVGKVFLFDIQGTTYTQTHTFFPVTSDPEDRFGSSLAISGDIVAIGSSYKGPQNKGAVYIYKKINNVWALTQTIEDAAASANALMGSTIAIYNNQLFVTTDSTESINVYNYNGTDWVFSQKLTYPTSGVLGMVMQIDNSKLVTTSINEFGEDDISTYVNNGGVWSFLSSTVPVGNLEINITDISMQGDRLVYVYSSLSGGTNVLGEMLFVNNNWADQQFILITNGGDQIFSSVQLMGEHLFVGSYRYILQMTRKFPLQHYTKINGSWNFINNYYGTGPSGADDRFGSELVADGSTLIAGAGQEGIAPFGKAYIVNAPLAVNDLQQNIISLYPNPTNGQLFLKNDGLSKFSNVEIYNVTGQLTAKFRGVLQSIDISALPEGIYFAKVSMDDATEKTFKVIKS